MPLLEVQALQKTYGHRRVVDQVSFHVDEGEIVGLLARNGAGKTTSFRMAMGMITPPFGVNLFAACSVAKISLDKIIGHLIPFVLVIIACLLLITYIPEISLTLRDFAYPPLPVEVSPSIGPQ